jgi:superfamily II DNA helicase RecQ
VSNRDIPRKLDQLQLSFKEKWEKGEARAIDIVLATNMLSVGVDVPRLGLMAVNGQPKNTAEYIQATSRVGRSFPGLVCTVLTWSRPRDLSHYETFEHYHASFYKHVEAQSVTPFAPRALDRGLTGTMVSLLRLENEELNPNEGAQALNSAAQNAASEVREAISERAWKVTDSKAAKNSADSMTAERIDKWVKEATRPGRILGYETVRNRGDIAALLKKPGASPWDEFTVPMSMREVEPGVRLIMDDKKFDGDSPQWRFRVIHKEEGDDE